MNTASNPPHLYIADAGNNRILGFKDFRAVAAGETANLVIGQPDFFHSEINYPTNSPTRPAIAAFISQAPSRWIQAGIFRAADEGNGRVLRLPSPFQQTDSGQQEANLVIGQLDGRPLPRA